MIPASDDAARGPIGGAKNDDSVLAARIECEPAAASEKELAEAFDGVAALLVDAMRAKYERARKPDSPPPFTPNGRLTGKPPPSDAGAEAA